MAINQFYDIVILSVSHLVDVDTFKLMEEIADNTNFPLYLSTNCISKNEFLISQVKGQKMWCQNIIEIILTKGNSIQDSCRYVSFNNIITDICNIYWFP